MGKKAKRKEKNKNTIDKKKDAPVKEKSAIDKLSKLASKNSTLKTEQKALVRQWKTLRKQHSILASEYQDMEKQAADLLKQVPKLQLESKEIKRRLAAEIKNTVQVRDRVDSLESREETDQEQVSAIKRQMEQHLRLLDDIRSQLATVTQLASQGEYLTDQIEHLQTGKKNLITEVNGLKSGNRGLESGYENLSARLDDTAKRFDESVERNQVVETWIENLNQADSELSLQLDQQHEQIQELVRRVEKLDQATHKNAHSYHLLQGQILDLRENLTSTEEHLVNRNAEMEKASQHLYSEHQHLTTKHGRLAKRALAAGILLLVLGAIGYAVKFDGLDQRALASSHEIERISERMKRQESKLTDQEQRLLVLKNEQESQSSVAGEWDAELDRINQSQGLMEANLQSFAEEQSKIAVKLMQFGEQHDEMDKRLEQTRSRFAKLINEQTEKLIEAKQQIEKLRLIEERLQKNPAQMKVAGTPVTPNVALNSDWLKGLNPKHFTIQILGAYDASMVSRVAAREDLQGAKRIYKGEFNNKDWYILLYGNYSSVSRARSAIQGLPEDIRANSPWIRNMSTVQNDLAEQPNPASPTPH